MAILTVQERSASPVIWVDAASGGDVFQNNGATELLVVNGSGSDITVTVLATGRCNHGFLDDVVETVPAGSLGRLGPFNPARLNDSQGRVSVSYSATGGIQVAAQKQR